MKLPTVHFYNDDLQRFADCEVEPASVKAWATMLYESSRLEKLTSDSPQIKLVGDFNPRAVLARMKERAKNGARAALICMDRDTGHLIYLWSDTTTDETYRLANIRADGFVLGTMTLLLSGEIVCHPECDEEYELKQLLLEFYARCFQLGRQTVEQNNPVSFTETLQGEAI